MKTKKTNKKLMLNKHTVANLNSKKLTSVIAGAASYTENCTGCVSRPGQIDPTTKLSQVINPKSQDCSGFNFPDLSIDKFKTQFETQFRTQFEITWRP